MLSLLLFESLFDEALFTVTFVLAPVIVPPASLPSASPTTVQYAFIVQLPAAFAVNENDCDVGSVSYTHLDVYKRQATRCSDMVTPRTSPLKPTSPKHMVSDVYKRQ